MPVYEYYCEHCDGIYEALRPMREAGDIVPCPACDRDGRRIMPTSFSAFTFREGYARKLPDDGTYWHLGKKVKSRIKGPFRPYEHPEINKPKGPKGKTKGELSAARDKREAQQGEVRRMRASGVRPSREKLPKKLR
jgi:putative FmdB family regulatory protein